MKAANAEIQGSRLDEAKGVTSSSTDLSNSVLWATFVNDAAVHTFTWESEEFIKQHGLLGQIPMSPEGA